MEKTIKKCCLCGKNFQGWGNNPRPIRKDGECCNGCNNSYVIIARIIGMKLGDLWYAVVDNQLYLSKNQVEWYDVNGQLADAITCLKCFGFQQKIETINKIKFRRKFNQILDKLDEFIMPNTKTDDILAIFQSQGYWAGCAYRIYYNQETNEFFCEERHFGV